MCARAGAERVEWWWGEVGGKAMMQPRLDTPSRPEHPHDMKRAHVKLGLGGLTTTLQLTPGELRHPVLIEVTSPATADRPLDDEPPEATSAPPDAPPDTGHER